MSSNIKKCSGFLYTCLRWAKIAPENKNVILFFADINSVTLWNSQRSIVEQSLNITAWKIDLELMTNLSVGRFTVHYSLMEDK